MARPGGLAGQTPIVHRPGQRQSASAASAVGARGEFWFCTYAGGLNGELFIELLRQLMHRRKKPVRLILDSLPAHKGSIGRRLGGLDERETELALPAPATRRI